jgi:uncharacterized RDD family membrane protein YckC
MKCPKCGYLGFETSERCRNCGYDFSLSVDIAPASELPLHSSEGAGEPLNDFDLSDLNTRREEESTGGLDLDRIIGAESPFAPAGATDEKPTSAAGGATAGIPSALPLFNDGDDDTPLITAPRPPRPPLAVRRTTPEIPRTRARRTTPAPEHGELAFSIEPVADEPIVTPPVVRSATLPAASATRRLGAAAIDGGLLAAINVAVIYLTLALARLSADQMNVLPILPIAMFFAILDGGYLVTFIAASGQTIGKMLVGIRVIGDDGRRVDIASAVLRAAGCGLSLLSGGLGYLPAFITTDGRALQDRIAGTRVISDR